MRQAFTVIVLLALTALPLAQARAADNGEWSVEPADSAITPRVAFQLSARPGTTLPDRAVVTNTTGEPLTFRLYMADAYNTARDGGLAVRGLSEAQSGVGAWGEPDRDTVTVAARSSVQVSFELKIPGDAPPGDHVGALVAVDDRVQNGAESHIGVQRAVGARIYLRVDGPLRPGLAVQGVRFTARNPLVPGAAGSTSTLSYTLHNTGNVTLDPKASLRIEGAFTGGSAGRQLANVPSEVLPGQKVEVSESWSGAPFAGWGTVTVTAAAGAARGRGSDTFLEIPWLVAAFLALLSAVGMWGLLLRRRMRKGVRQERNSRARASSG